MQASKIIKPKGVPHFIQFQLIFPQEEVSALESKVASALHEIEKSSAEFEELLGNLFIQKVVQLDLQMKNDEMETVLLVYIPYPCLKVMKNAHEKLVPQLELHLGQKVLMTAARKIQSRWRKVHRSQKRPRSRTLTHVHNAILADLVYPSEIIGKRERYRVDGSKFYKAFLEKQHFDVLESKTELIEALYKKLTSKEVRLEFKEEPTYYVPPSHLV